MIEVRLATFHRRESASLQSAETRIAGPVVARVRAESTGEAATGDYAEGHESRTVRVPRTPVTDGIEVGDSLRMAGDAYEVKGVTRTFGAVDVTAERVARVA